MNNVLILTNSSDVHAHILVGWIEKYGGCIFRVDFDRLRTHFFTSIFYNKKNPTLVFETPVGTIWSDSIYSIWFRRPYELKLDENNLDQKIIIGETNDFIRSLSSFFPKKTLQVDHPANIGKSSRKAFQLLLAKKMGLTIPNTIITNSPKEAKGFISEQQNGTIIKSLVSGYVEANNKAKSIFTTFVSPETNIELVKNAPTLFQENIQKKSEIRVTIIGSKVFSVEFDSQLNELGRIDWRKDPDILKVPHRVIQLPTKLEHTLLKYKNYFGLNFSTIDLALTPSGDYVFFELNPSGQFLWLEDLTGLPLASEMAKFLLGKK